jgi:hypothetical protein
MNTPLNPEIKSVLEAHGLDWNTFKAMDPRSYEHQLARHLPAQLDAFYSVLFGPGLSQEERVAKCPPWPLNTPQAGKQPTFQTLYNTIRRWNAVRSLDTISEVGDVTKNFRARLKKMPTAQTDQVTDTLCAMLSQEVLTSKLEGRSLSAQTRALTQLLRKQKLRLDEQVFNLAREKYEFDAATACLKKLPELKRVSKKPKMTEAQKTRAIQKILFPWGKPKEPTVTPRVLDPANH